MITRVLILCLILFFQVSCDTVECTECVPECTDPMCEPEGEEAIIIFTDQAKQAETRAFPSPSQAPETHAVR